MQQFKEDAKNIKQASSEGRYQNWKPKTEDVVDLVQSLDSSENDRDLLLLLQHCDRPIKEIFDPYTNYLGNLKENSLRPFALSVGMKHLIPIMERDGIKVSDDLKTILVQYLKSGHLETAEWSLRFIDQLGAAGSVFKEDVLSYRRHYGSFGTTHSKIFSSFFAFLR